MASIQNYQALNSAGRAFQSDSFIQASEQLDGLTLIDFTADDEVELDHPSQNAPRLNKFLRNRVLEADHWSVEEVAVKEEQYKVGQFVELGESVGEHSTEFVEIKFIYIHKDTGDIVIRGLPYSRTRNLHGCLPRKQNEVCLILEIDDNDTRADEEQGLLEIRPEEILKRRVLTTTNKSFPHCRFDPVGYSTPEQRETQAPLTCRWKMRLEYKDASQRRAGRHQGQALEHMSEHDSHKIKRRNLGIDKERSQAWRGETVPGGSALSEPDLIKDENMDNIPARVQKYSFAEVSGGAGGASRGAEMGGLTVVLATESCTHACNTYRSNFPDTELYEMEATEFATGGDRRIVDILHISSSALSAAEDDHEAAQKICTDLMNNFHPRFFTMEQLPTITSEQKIAFLNAIIQSFTKLGYSVQWKLVHMVDYGLPQTRKRFIMIGAGPGETLPSWPIATHSLAPTGDQQPFKTEEEAIGGLRPELHSLHNPEELRTVNRSARNADKPLGTTISGGGSVFSHQDGEREFTIRELACLQGFPTYHQFEGSYIKKQIGNAFPPSVAMAFYQSIRQHMENVDGVQLGLLQPDEPAGSPDASSAEVRSDTPVRMAQRREAADATPDEVMPDAPLNAPRIAQSHKPSRNRAAVSPAPPRLTMPPGVQSDMGTRQSTSQTPSPPQQLLTPTTSSRFIAGQRAAALRMKRDRAAYEKMQSDGDDDYECPNASHTPSKRARTSLRR
ncbi:hypothetical protein N8I77_006729 [Diaporthe amygdali]|uniref:DNA (cytosine-5-)-methyltransferase n=1 Tax=Phomopsis amygdali TaxID=1214568 RepID=A0AAD9W6W0_PHOAM|nr:hypothetical protein N8I77_006729 [Diaporthe amygdali]